ncbi:pantothenate synthetase PanC [Thermacetogenium phaeum DSM 12270]|uniref:Pantothenate synthetase n=1 Tax=Thermacetogenium phaeum (strain ATCC BAA-254 / DSM 26808 / PB) TaxID=1089553 RepID=K4LY27_THEPS|nr:pantoate--beta-alanine ligase [Thermacetogenium phaeum]AFV12839.1 pantothenate synthetase PanC [Thermacetogenium phaeum DSM 12270]
MEVITRVAAMQELCLHLKRSGKSIGLVPTMGYLHEGHLSLIRAARGENDIVVMSNFVNPLQFGPKEDFATYPRDPERDNRLAEAAGVDYVFAPSGAEMYPEGYSTFVEVKGDIAEKMCGRSRPGHFRGVTTVVLKLFLITQPDRAYFGQKDAQQAVIIKKMVADLNIPVRIVTCPIIREADGLALSSRNTYLSPEERKQALALPRALSAGKEMILKGETDPRRVRQEILRVLESSPGIRVDYVEVVGGEDLAELGELKGRVLLAAAVYVGKTRLIDNIDLEVRPCTAPC